MPMPIHPFHPDHTPLPLRTGRLLRVPIKHKLGGTEAVCGFRLPTVVIGNRAKQVNLMIGATGQQRGRGQILSRAPPDGHEL
jgi:hypothetical protein